MLCTQCVPAPIDPAPSGRARPRPGSKFGAHGMSTPIARTLVSRCIGPGALSHSEPQLGKLVALMRSTVGQWFARSRQRRTLREIAERNDCHLLKDIGVSQEEALQEADKPF